MGSCGGRIFVGWVADYRVWRNGMRGHVPGTDGYETEDYGTGTEPGHVAAVRKRTVTIVRMPTVTIVRQRTVTI